MSLQQQKQNKTQNINRQTKMQTHTMTHYGKTKIAKQKQETPNKIQRDKETSSRKNTISLTTDFSLTILTMVIR